MDHASEMARQPSRKTSVDTLPSGITVKISAAEVVTAPGSVVFLVALPAMFVIGLLLQGRLFPFVWTEPLVALAAVAAVWAGLPYFVAKALGYGGGNVVSATYEYGNTFAIVAGLLNGLVMLDAFDIALGRK